jgi:hypothetical protein
MYLIAISSSTETNYNKLTDTHQKILGYTQRYRIRFVSAKYELVHFTRVQNRFNLVATIQLGQGAECTPLPNVQVLGIWLDTKLNWKAYTKVVREKGVIVLTALSRLNQITWSPILHRAQVLYTVYIYTVLTYGAEV